MQNATRLVVQETRRNIIDAKKNQAATKTKAFSFLELNLKK